MAMDEGGLLDSGVVRALGRRFSQIKGSLIRGTLYIAVGSAVVWYCYALVLYGLIWPAEPILQGINSRFTFLNIWEPFFLKLQIAMVGGAVVGLHLFVFDLWAGLKDLVPAPGRRVFYIAAPLAAFFFFLGMASGYLVLPWVFRFLAGYIRQQQQQSIPIELLQNPRTFLTLELKLLLTFGLLYQIPVILGAFARLGVISFRGLLAAWQYALVGSFIVAAVITPPDFASQFLFAIPLVVLYLVSLVTVFIGERLRIFRERAADVPPAIPPSPPAGPKPLRRRPLEPEAHSDS